MKQLFSIIIALFIGFIPAIGATPTASSVMQACATKLKSATSFTASFTMPQNGTTALSGELSVKGNKFAYKTGQAAIIYNGTTQWTVDKSSRDISIYNPEQEEIEQINPFAVISNYSTKYNLRLISFDSASATAKVKLTPKISGDISAITVSVNTNTNLPSRFDITTSDGGTVVVNITSINTSVNIPASTFVVDVNKYPGYEITDLR